MSKEKQRLFDYLNHILQVIHRIQVYTEDMPQSMFLQNEMVQDAVIRNFEIIGEASRNIQQTYPEFVVTHPELPLIFAYGMRNALMHGYFEVDLQTVWDTVHNDLPKLQQQVRKIAPDVFDQAGVAEQLRMNKLFFPKR